jgi:hypothetical protein
MLADIFSLLVMGAGCWGSFKIGKAKQRHDDKHPRYGR